jgi:RNA polymerase sigma-70 factor (ECF subfamily)
MTELSEEWNLLHIADKNNEIDKIALQRAIMKLSDEYREPLVLQIIAGFSTDEIAKMMSLNSNTVSTRLFRARAELKKMMFSENVKVGKKNG